MKAFKLTLGFSVLVFAGIGALMVVGILNQEEAIQVAGRAIAVICIFGIASAVLIQTLSSSKSGSESDSDFKQPGPRF
jgi:hypothetical protein